MEASYTDKHCKKKAEAQSTEKVFLGKRFELEAERYFERIGYLLVAKNLHLGWAEIDLLFLEPKRNALLLVEVRGRSKPSYLPSLMIGYEKKKRLNRVARYLSAKYRKTVSVKLCEVCLLKNNRLQIKNFDLF